MSDSTTAPSTQLTAPEHARALQVIGRMPYAASIIPLGHHFGDTRPMTVADLLTGLEELADRLTKHADHDTARDAELERHRKVIRAGREVFAVLAGKDV